MSQATGNIEPPIMTQPNTQVLSGTDMLGLFKAAQDTFLGSLSEEERKAFPTCRSADELLQSVRKFEVLGRGERKGMAMILKIQTFSDKMSPFFKIIDIFCSTHPEWANIGWGALRLILQLASNFGTFFESLCETLNQLTAEFPRFTEIYNSFYRTGYRGANPFSQRLPEALVRFHTCIFDFFHSVSRVFTRKDGRLKRTPVYVVSIMWQPFNTRFADILKRMKSCREIVQKELDLVLLQELGSQVREGADRVGEKMEDINKVYEEFLEIKSSFDEAAKWTFDQRLNQWLSPPSYKSPFENAMDAKSKGTSEWLFDEPIFQAWNRPRDASSELDCAILWVQGNPGSGKTVLAASTIDFLRETPSEGETDARVVCYFFFDGAGSSPGTRLSAYRALATQLYQQCNELEYIRDIFAFAARGPLHVSSASENELLDVLRLCLSALPCAYLVVDGVDECAENTVTRFVVDICQLCDASRARVALFSRPTVAALRQPKSPIWSISMQRSRASGDIAVFFERELDALALVASSLLQRGADGGPSALVRHLVDRADGMFLWARLMVAYLNSPALTPTMRLAIIRRETPERIDDLYGRIFDMILGQDKPSQLLARQVFLWCTHAYRQLTTQQLRDVVSGRGLGGNPDDLLMDFDSAVIMSCRGLIERRPDGRFHFIHATAKDFLASRTIVSQAGVDFTPSSWTAACEITHTCVRYLIFAIPLQPLSGHIAKPAAVDDLRAAYPFLEYASLNWPHHLRESAERAPIGWDQSAQITSLYVCLETLKRFLTFKHNIMLWIEAFYTFRQWRMGVLSDNMGGCVGALRAAAAALEKLDETFASTSSRIGSLHRDLDEFAGDILKLHAAWSATLCSRPQEIWGDVTVFTRSRFLIPTSAASMECLSADGPSKKDTGKARFSVSETSSDMQQMAVLSVWPSEPFEMFWTKTKEFRAAMAERCRQDDMLGASAVPDIEGDRILRSMLCSGWKATFEVYQIGDNTTRPRTVIIPLKEEEVAIQLRQSLRGFWDRWKLNFPLTISSSLSTFAILRSVYTARVESSRFKVSAPETLDVGYIDPDACYWSDRRAFFALPYLYNVKIGCGDTFLVFQDEDLGFRPAGECSMTAFSLHVRGGEPKVRYLNRLPYRLAVPGGSLCVLHNRHPRLLFAASNKLHLWDLQGPRAPLASVHEIPTDIEDIGFSECGEYFTIKRLGNKWPSVFPLPPMTTTKHPRGIHDDDSDNEDTEGEERGKRQRRGEPQAMQESTISVLGTLEVVGMGGTQMHCLSKSGTGSGVESVELRNRQDSADEVACLLSLPRTISMQETRPSVRLPGSQDDKAVIVLNRQRPFSYQSDDASDLQLPIVVRRDPRSIVFVKQNYIEDGSTDAS